MSFQFFTKEWILMYGGWSLTILLLFLESAIPAGILISGSEVLLLITGLIAGTKWLHVNILFAIIPISLSAFMGDLTGYTYGHTLDNPLNRKKDTLFFKKRYVRRLLRFRAKYGMMEVIYSRFLPVLRTFSPIVNGAIETNFNNYFRQSLIGCAVYVSCYFFMGYFIGKLFPYLVQYMDILVAIIILYIFISPLVTLLRVSLSNRGDKYSIEE